MAWNTNPLYVPGPDEKGATTRTDIETAQQQQAPPAPSVPSGDESGTEWNFREPASTLTRRLAVYLFVLNGVVAAVFAAGINFGTAYGTYHTQRAIKLFRLPNALAADAGFTLLSQFLITWAFECFIVTVHLRQGQVPPIGFVKAPTSRFMRWYFILDTSGVQPTLKSPKDWLKLFFDNAVRSLILLLFCFPVIFGPTVGFLTLAGTRRGDDWYYPVVYAPQIFKVIFGFVVSGVGTPLIASYWLFRAGWIMKARSSGSAAQGDGDEEGVMTA